MGTLLCPWRGDPGTCLTAAWDFAGDAFLSFLYKPRKGPVRASTERTSAETPDTAQFHLGIATR
jgi:hypothetical protein